jgi:hypothetical protein
VAPYCYVIIIKYNAVSITYYKFGACIFVLITRHANRTFLAIICYTIYGLSSSAVLCCNYLVNGKIFAKYISYVKCVFRFPLPLLYLKLVSFHEKLSKIFMQVSDIFVRLQTNSIFLHKFY